MVLAVLHGLRAVRGAQASDELHQLDSGGSIGRLSGHASVD